MAGQRGLRPLETLSPERGIVSITHTIDIPKRRRELKKIYTLVVALMLGVATVQGALAQPPGGFGRGFGRGMMGGGGMRLLTIPEVQKELKLKPDQVEKAKAAAGKPLDASDAAALGLVTESFDEVDWADEVQIGRAHV